jgi:hypothetical protein
VAFDYRLRPCADGALKEGHGDADQQSMTSIRKIALLALTAAVPFAAAGTASAAPVVKPTKCPPKTYACAFAASVKEPRKVTGKSKHGVHERAHHRHVITENVLSPFRTR